MSYEMIDTIRRICDEVGGEFRDDYSGRGMFGRTCVGIDTSDPGFVFNLAREYNVPAPTQDNMGLDYILYWPSISMPKPEATETNEDSPELDVNVTLEDTEEKKEVHISEIIEKVSEDFKSQTINITEKENQVLRGILKFIDNSETAYVCFRNKDILEFTTLSLKQISGVFISLKKKKLIDSRIKAIWSVTDNGLQVLES